jgi:hypothetical protein
MDTTQLRLTVTNASDAYNMGIELWLDAAKFFDNTISPGQHHIVHDFDSTADGDHVFKIVLKNKDATNTRVDEVGNIIEDALINIKGLSFDDIEIDQVMHEMAEYVHDANGTRELASHRFYGDLGCNGTVCLSFATPLYLWLLENM